MWDIKEIYKKLRNAFGEELFEKYKQLLNMHVHSKMPRVKFDNDAKKLVVTKEQWNLHKIILIYLSSRHLLSNENDFNPKNITFDDFFLSEDSIRTKLAVLRVNNHISVESNVSSYIFSSTQILLKNIITAVASNTNGYLIRKKKLHTNIGLPVPNPWLRNASTIPDKALDSNVSLNADAESFEPKERDCLEFHEDDFAFNYACGSVPLPIPGTKIVTLRHLYETLLHDSVIVNHARNSDALEKIAAQLDCS